MLEKHRSTVLETRRMALLSLLVVGVGAAAPAHADTAADAFKAWNDAFLVRQSGDVYYATTVTTAGTMRQGTWVGALDIAVAEDRYQHTHAATDRQLVSDLMTTFVAKEGTVWKNNSTWNDDLAWMIIAGVRAYQIAGNDAWLKVASDAWNAAYDRGWDTQYAGGGIWEDMGHITPWDKPSKCGLSNHPIVLMGVALYQITGDQTFLAKSKQIYAWSRKILFVPATGQVYGCIGFPSMTDTVGKLEGGNNAYDSGSFAEMADALFRVTGDDSYHQDAVRAIDLRIGKDAILHDGAEGETQWAYRFTKGLSDFCTFNDQWPKYEMWLRSNANAAWSMRDALNITWNDWTKQTTAPGLPGVPHANDVVALCTSSATAIWQHLPPDVPTLPTGTVELRNMASGLSVAIASATQGAPVVMQPYAGAPESQWTFVQTPGGYVQIRNVRSGMLVGAGGLTGKQGALLVQAPDQGLRPGADRWLPVKNDDGTFSFYNLSSVFALDDPNGSTAAGTQLDQWAGNGTAAQKFQVVAREATSDGGATDADASADVDGTGDAPATDGAGVDAGESHASGAAGTGGGPGVAGAGNGGVSGGGPIAPGTGGAAGQSASGSGGTGGQGAAHGGTSGCAIAPPSNGAALLWGLGLIALSHVRRRRR
jgi:hypothetical protein